MPHQSTNGPNHKMARGVDRAPQIDSAPTVPHTFTRYVLLAIVCTTLLVAEATFGPLLGQETYYLGKEWQYGQTEREQLTSNTARGKAFESSAILFFGACGFWFIQQTSKPKYGGPPRHRSPLWRVFSREHRPGHCVACGYDRRGLPRGTPCPECGQEPGWNQ